MRFRRLSPDREARRVELSRRKWQDDHQCRPIALRAAARSTLATRLFGWMLVLVAIFACDRPASAQFLGFNLPRPGRSLSTAPPLAESNVPHPAVVRVVVDERTSLSHGTGVLVAAQDQHALVLTNWHVVRDVAGPINVIFPSGFMSPARIVKTDKDWDLAALGIWNPNAIPIPVAKAPPRVGEPLTIAGYGSGQYRAVTGKCNQFLSPGERFPYEMIEVSVEARRGDSGGPILNQQGELAGILFGASTGTTSGSHSGRVRRFVSPWIAMVDRPHAELAAGQVPSSSAAPTMSPTNPGQDRGAAGMAPLAGGAASAGLLTPQPSLTTSPYAPNTMVGANSPIQPTSVGNSPFAAPASSAPLVTATPDGLLARAEVSPTNLAPVPIAGSSLNSANRSSQPAGSAGAFSTAEKDFAASTWATHPISPVEASPTAKGTSRSSSTPLDHVKNVMAIVGGLALVFHLFRRAPANSDD